MKRSDGPIDFFAVGWLAEVARLVVWLALQNDFVHMPGQQKVVRRGGASGNGNTYATFKMCR